MDIFATPIFWVLLLVISTLALGAVLAEKLAATRRNRVVMRELKAEYDRVLQEQVAGSPGPLMSSGLAAAPDSNGIRPLLVTQRKRYAADWASVQSSFVDSPAASLTAAYRLIAMVMRARDYPLDKFGNLADVVAAFHPHAGVSFRLAHAMTRPRASNPASTEQMRQSFLQQRALFFELLDNAQNVDLAQREQRPQAAHPSR